MPDLVWDAVLFAVSRRVLLDFASVVAVLLFEGPLCDLLFFRVPVEDVLWFTVWLLGSRVTAGKSEMQRRTDAAAYFMLATPSLLLTRKTL